MKRFRFKKIDAFTKGESTGNPAACVYLNELNDITAEEMQLIAKELKGFVNEVVYIFPEKQGYFLKYYSSECEVDFCGHGTIAAMYDCIKSDKELSNKEIINIRVKNYDLDVFNTILQDGSIYIMAPLPEYKEAELNLIELSEALNIDINSIDSNFEINLINAGLNTLIVPIKNINTCVNMFPEQAKLKEYCLRNGIDIVIVFTNEVANKENEYRTRVFAPKFGYLEDPATGSGNSAFGYYLMKKNLWNGRLLSIEQNNSISNPNIVKLKAIKKGKDIHIIFGGAATVKIDGEYNL